MTREVQRPWLEIPVPNYAPMYDPEEWKRPKTRGDKDYDEALDDEERVIIINL